MVGSMPKIPDPLDDEESAQESAQEETSESSESATKTPEPLSRQSHATPTSQANTERLSAPRTPKPRRRVSGWHKLPAEIRFAIYEEVLVFKNPIHVHSGWKSVYKRQDLGIPTSILRTCRDVYNEAIGVLYGRNTFLYKLRDQIPRVTDVDRVAHIDEDDAVLPSNTAFDPSHEAGDEDHEVEYENHSDPDWQEEPNGTYTHQPRRNRRRKTRSSAAEADINIDKHLHLFRQIIVEAEKNRFSSDTRSLMASAIKAFEYKPDAENPSPGTNIHTLKLRVAPTWENTGEGEDEGRFTFVDFFSLESPVIKAVRGVQAQFVRIEMKCATDDESTRGGFSLKIDMRDLRVANRVRCANADMWKGDVVMQRNRMKRSSRARHALTSLDDHVAGLCEQHLKKDGPGGGAWQEFYITF